MGKDAGVGLVSLGLQERVDVTVRVDSAGKVPEKAVDDRRLAVRAGNQPVALQDNEGLADGQAADPEDSRKFRFRGQACGASATSITDVYLQALDCLLHGGGLVDAEGARCWHSTPQLI